MKRLLFFAILIASIFAIHNLVRSIYTLWRKQDLLVAAKKDVEREKEKNKELLAKLKVVESEQFIEEEARNKLFMVKEGEHFVVLPEMTKEEQGKTVQKDTPYWKQWIDLFFEKQ